MPPVPTYSYVNNTNVYASDVTSGDSDLLALLHHC